MARAGMYWVIVVGNVPTSFRARDQETLIPTLKQLQRKQPDAVIRWFDGTRFFENQERADDRGRERDGFRKERKKDWRPGGDHKDPRAKYQISRDVRRARFKERLVMNSRADEPGTPDASAGSDAPRPERPPFRERKPFAERKPYAEQKPFGERKPLSEKRAFNTEKKP
ncbi:MAG: hypothetical protein WCQ64_05045, partial [Acidobacteriota bacterium]